MSDTQDSFGSLELAPQILLSWSKTLELALSGMGDTIPATAENAAVNLWRCTVKLLSAEMKIARALSASAVLASELDKHSSGADDARARAILAVDTLALLLSQTQSNDLAQVA